MGPRRARCPLRQELTTSERDAIADTGVCCATRLRSTTRARPLSTHALASSKPLRSLCCARASRASSDNSEPHPAAAHRESRRSRALAHRAAGAAGNVPRRRARRCEIVVRIVAAPTARTSARRNGRTRARAAKSRMSLFDRFAHVLIDRAPVRHPWRTHRRRALHVPRRLAANFDRGGPSGSTASNRTALLEAEQLDTACRALARLGVRDVVHLDAHRSVHVRSHLAQLRLVSAPRSRAYTLFDREPARANTARRRDLDNARASVASATAIDNRPTRSMRAPPCVDNIAQLRVGRALQFVVHAIRERIGSVIGASWRPRSRRSARFRRARMFHPRV